MTVTSLYSFGTKLVLALMLLGLLLMLGYTLAYRLEDPGLTRMSRQQTQEQAQGQEMMDMLSGLMQRLEEDPEDIENLQRLGLVFMRMEAWDRAVQFWKRVLSLEPENIEARQQLANCYYRMEEYAQAAFELNKVLEIDPDEPFANFNLGLLYAYYLESPEQARSYFRTVLESPAADQQLKDQARQELDDLQE